MKVEQELAARPLSPAEARKKLQEQGISLAEWASEHGFPRHLVYAVASGQRKCLRGESHRVAVALGIKPTPSSQAASRCCA